MKKNIILISVLALVLSSCFKEDMNSGGIKSGYAPVYISKSVAFNTSVSGPESLNIPGKMYLFNNYVFLTDVGRGVHILNNSNPASPTKIKFISIPGVHDVAVKNGVLYADNLTDLVAFNISDLNNITLSKRIKNVYPLENQLYPDFATGYFECSDTTKGYIIRWESKTLTDPKCYR